MIPALDALRERFGVDLADIAGAAVSSEIPINDAFVNRLIADRIRNHPQIASVRLQAQDDDRVAIQLTPRLRLMPPMKIDARIERQPDFPRDPALVFRWKIAGIGPLAMLAAPALSFFNAWPRGIRADGDRIAVDLRELLESRGLGELVRFVRRAGIHTRSGAFVVRLEIGVSFPNTRERDQTPT